MAEKPAFSRRTMLSLTAAGLVGSGTAIAAQSSDDATVTEYDTDASVDVDNTSWPMPNHDGGRTKYNPNASVPTGTLSPRWKHSGSIGVPTVSNGVAYYTRGRVPDDVPPEEVTRTLHAIDVDSWDSLWETELGTPDEWHSHRLAVADDVVYASQRSHTQAFDATDGSELWSADTGGYGPVVTDESLVVHGGQIERHWSDDLVVLSRDDGSVRWRMDSVAKPVVVNGSVFVLKSGEDDSGIYSLDVETGETQWKRELSAVVSVATESELYVDQDNVLLALDPETGETKWQYNFTEVIEPPNSNEWGWEITVHVADEERVYVDCSGDFFALNATTGEKVWRNDEVDALRLVGTSDGLYHIVDEGWRDDKPGCLIRRDKETGESITKQKIVVSQAPVNSEQFIITDGRVYTTIGRFDSRGTVALVGDENGGDDGSDDDSDDSDDSDDNDDC
ncbi:outer membrane protein assembly factor BamB family protein [Haladaptatus cibarius]|uniref:outer membrane protein assembly factor BamB family protein n=1 Tax=Haladaptatus cibarius TaxID=453847 RepID=UPI000678E558|nr:PQQ-binding-like beta-propeller repeat protein [Haladaptatus cibarius]